MYIHIDLLLYLVSYVVLNKISKLGTYRDDFYLTMIPAAFAVE